MSNIILPTVVYHGTTSNWLESIKESISLKRGSKWADFGQGFYTTSNFDQARKWAEKRRNSYNTFQLNSKTFVDAVVITYELDLEKINHLRGIIFDKQSEEWIKFIYRNRSRKESFKHNYDYVFGSVADGNVDRLIKDYDDDIISIDELRESIRHKFELDTSNQLSFHSQRAIELLVFKKEVIYRASKKISR